MNAYELADFLDYKLEDVFPHHQDTIDMLRQLAKEKELLQNQSSELAKEVMYFQEQNRQQSDRIAELEKLLEHSVGSDCREMRYIQEIENKDARIAELEKDKKELHAIAQRMAMAESDARKSLQSCKDAKSEPVAWIACDADLPLTEDGSYWLYPANPSENKRMYIPLYTTPQTKPLSDEEIKELHKSWTRWIDGGYELQVVHFARAIEERHGIK